jgi:hypothetical protein
MDKWKFFLTKKKTKSNSIVIKILLIHSPKVCFLANRNVKKIFLIHLPNKGFMANRNKNFFLIKIKNKPNIVDSFDKWINRNLL